MTNKGERAQRHARIDRRVLEDGARILLLVIREQEKTLLGRWAFGTEDASR